MAGSSSLPDPLQKLLAVNPLMPEAEAGSENLSSAARYGDYLLRAAVFVVLIGLGYLITRLTRHKRGHS